MISCVLYFCWFILGHVDEANQITVIIDKEETTIEFVDTEEKMVGIS
jgi:IS4 transposase